jgi:CBS domain-containing protein
MSATFEGTRMILVEHILDAAVGRLAVLSRESLVCDAAAILMKSNTPLAVVCDGEGIAVGVISRTDVVKVFTRATDDAFDTRADAMMTRRFLSCHGHQSLQLVWELMNARSLRCLPVLDDEGRPQGILHARDVASALIDDVAKEEIVLRDYVLGIGYQ